MAPSHPPNRGPLFVAAQLAAPGCSGLLALAQLAAPVCRHLFPKRNASATESLSLSRFSLTFSYPVVYSLLGNSANSPWLHSLSEAAKTRKTNSLKIRALHTLAALFCTGAKANPCGIYRFRTLCENTGGVPLYSNPRLKYYLKVPASQPF
jgi:hypothetical protein